MAPATLEAADAIRELLAKPVIVTSAARCVDHNKRVGGVGASWHLPRNVNGIWQSHAMDLGICGKHQDLAVKMLDDDFPEISYIRYSTFTHIDSRPKLYRGDFRR